MTIKVRCQRCGHVRDMDWVWIGVKNTSNEREKLNVANLSMTVCPCCGISNGDKSNDLLANYIDYAKV